MERPYFRDYSSSEAQFRPNKMHKIDELFFLQDQINYEKTNLEFKSSNWFAKRMKDYVKFLSFAIPGYESSAMESLLYAYQHPGTANSLINLCFGLFGKDSTILLEIEPAVVGLTVSNVNIAFFYGWVDQSEDGSGIVEKSIDGDLIVFEDFQGLAGNSLSGLIKQFLPAGWSLNFEIIL